MIFAGRTHMERATCALLLLGALLLQAPLSLPGQMRRRPEGIPEERSPIRLESYSFPAPDRGLSRLDVQIWIEPSLLVFVRRDRKSVV